MNRYEIIKSKNYAYNHQIITLILTIINQKIKYYSSWLEMQNSKTNRDSSKITSYNQFIQMVKQQKGSKKTLINACVQDHNKQKEKQKQTKKNSNKSSIIQSKVVTKCITEIAQESPQEFQSSIDSNHYISRQSNNNSNHNSNAFISIQNFRDSQNYTTVQNNKQNIYTQRRSCSKNLNNLSCEYHEDTKTKQINTHHNNEGVAHFLINQILLIVQEITKFNRQRITYLDFLEILRQLNMIQSNYEPTKQDCVYKLWGILTAYNKENTTCLINLTIIILAVMNIRGKIKSIKDYFQNVCYSTDSLKSNNLSFKKVNTLNKSIHELKKNKQGYFELSKQEVFNIYKDFKQLRVTRMYLGRINKKSELIQEKSLEYSKHSFKPQISERSKSLAKGKRQKDFLNLQSINHHDLIEYQIKTERQRKELQQCTFQPNSSRIYDTPLSISIGKKRSQLLYKMGKSKSKQKKRDKKQDQIQFEKNKQVYTFKPQLMNGKKSMEKLKKIESKVEGQNKQIDRMIKARLQKQVKLRAQERGIPYNQKQIAKLRKKITSEIIAKSILTKKSFQIKQPKQEKKIQQKTYQGLQKQLTFQCNDEVFPKQATNEKKQIFTFEVYLQQNTCVDKITIYEGDIIEQVAHQFITRHKLKQSMQIKLISSLKSHLSQLNQNNNLCKIDEESIEYSIQM